MTAVRIRSAASLIASIAAIVFAAAMMLLVTGLRHGTVAAEDDRPSMTIAGQSHIRIAPDEVSYQVRFESRAKSPAAAADVVNQQVRQMTRMLKAAGVKGREIAVTDASTMQLSRRRWLSSSTATITLRGVDRSDDVLKVLRRLNVAWMQGPTFSVGDENEVRERAMADAVASARRKADIAARRGGMRVAGIQQLDEQGVEIRQPGGYDRLVSPVIAEAAASTDVKTGEIAVATYGGEFTAVASVSVQFLLKPT